MPDKYQQIADALNAHPDYWAKLITTRHDPIQRNDYLILFARCHTDVIHQLVLMGDHSVTWRPFKAEDTPEYCRIDVDNLPTAIQHMMILTDAWDAGQLPRGADEGEGTGKPLINPPRCECHNNRIPIGNSTNTHWKHCPCHKEIENSGP